MRKWICRIIGIICIIAAVCTAIMLPCIQLKSVKSKQLKELQGNVTSLAETVNEAYSKDKTAYMDACEEIDIEWSKQEVRQWITRIKETGKTVLSGELSLLDITKTGLTLNGALKLIQKPVEDHGTAKVLQVITGNGWTIDRTEAEAIDDIMSGDAAEWLRIPGRAMLGLVIVLCALALVAVVLTALNKGSGARWSFFAVVLLLAGTLVAGCMLVNGAELEFPEPFEKATLACTVWPFIAVALALAGALVLSLTKGEGNKNRVNAKKTILITGVVVVATGLAVVFVLVGLPAIRYGQANALYKDEEYAEAKERFEEMSGYRESKTMVKKCDYRLAEQAYEEGEYEKAAGLFESLGDYRDSKERAETCRASTKESIYCEAVRTKEAGEYEKAVLLFESLDGYKDSTEQIGACRAEAKRIATYEEAVALQEAGEYDKAIEMFGSLDGYGDSEARIQGCHIGISERSYNEALALQKKGKYDDAVDMFEGIKDYKDSAIQITECKYQKMITLRDTCQYDEAVAGFTALNDYKDSKEQISECRYREAKELTDVGAYETAYRIFASIDGYKDSGDIVQNNAGLLKARNTAWQPGKVVTIGYYEQDGINTNGKEQIEWLVLARKGDSALVISKYGLDAKQYHKIGYWSPGGKTIRWDECSLRAWLNEDFINAAFTPEEKMRIIPTEVSRSGATGINEKSDSGDKLFVFSSAEVARYFKGKAARKCALTRYAIERIDWYSDIYTDDGKLSYPWWTRSLTSISPYDLTAMVDNDGELNAFTGYDVFLGIRPVMWIQVQ